jgi:hypothetical protein
LGGNDLRAPKKVLAPGIQELDRKLPKSRILFTPLQEDFLTRNGDLESKDFHLTWVLDPTLASSGSIPINGVSKCQVMYLLALGHKGCCPEKKK